MTDQEMLKRAEEIATAAHKGQVDKAGEDYILHPKAVAALCHTVEEKTVAWLHDVIEDTGVTAAELRKEGFPEEIVHAVELVTKVKDENYTYEGYLRGIKANELARVVKIADMTHNLNRTRMPHPTEEDERRWQRYEESLVYLKEKKNVTKR